LEKLTILGCGSALPASGRHPTAQVIEHNGKFLLIDCGEGTQLRLRENKVSFDKITHIFISHLHGDHYFGLAGLLSSMSLLGRTRDIKLFGPPELLDIIELQFAIGKTFFVFSLTI
jgi:ribonuclease Z